ncbi:phospholipid-transporting ATPase ABCA3-like [Oppia nitens]|uniref:phospholipid-transporting ATPase ABCA3-like n=1 Tax=Oppia nitens TaxID=1686743 RepID=UPI0023DC780C|nr:phospholipid-transporting ATPase ABCA3-like [Oppia nitens]
MSVINDLRLLLWKNFMLQIRHPVVTVVELLVPCLFVAMLAAIRIKVDYTIYDNTTVYNTFSLDNIPELKLDEQMRAPQWWILYAPNTTRVHDIIETRLYNRLTGISGMQFEFMSFATEADMISFYNKQETGYPPQSLVLCGIIITSGDDQLANRLNYTLRFSSTPRFQPPNRLRPLRNWWTQFTFPLFAKPGPRAAEYDTGAEPGYQEDGFLTIQHAVAMSVASYITQSPSSSDDIDSDVTVRMQRFPYPSYIDDIFLLALQFLFPFILMLSFIYPAVNLVKNIVIEKEKRLKESMKMMGLKNWLHWIAWFIKTFVWLTVTTGLLSLLLTMSIKDGVGIMNASNGFLIFFYFVSYSISCISFSFLMSTLFSKANVSAIGGGVLFFMAFMPYFSLFPRYRDLGLVQKLASCLSCNTALAMGSMIIAMWEGNSVGIQWSNLNETASPDDTLTVGYVLVMFYVDTVIYLVMTWYIESVFPGEYGVPLKWYFPFSRSYWFGRRQVVGDEEKVQLNSPQHNGNVDDNSDSLEREPLGLRTGIQISHLSKTFGGKKFAVNDLNLNAYKGQITALLGHNGAGKTTTMSILTGLFPPSSGTALVNGYDIRKDMNRVRSSLGICPQFDVLFDELTVEEHLYFYCELKNYSRKDIGDEITYMIELLGLTEKRHKAAGTLSGGQKRKLSVGIALVGKSKIVILDEPTSGMDVYARRFTWDLLLKEKTDRTILLSTHFMEEADVLGERIAIMANGQLQCCGSPLFLKKRYGAGYHLTIVKSGESTDIGALTRLIQSHIVEAKMNSNAGSEISYSLPDHSSSHFESLFTTIEMQKLRLGIDSYGVSITTMEEVFLRVGQYAEDGMKGLAGDGSGNADRIKTADTRSEVSLDLDTAKDDPNARNTGFPLIRQQFYALFMKKVLYTMRNRTLTLSQLTIPTFFALMVLITVKTLPKLGESPGLALTLDNYKGAEVPYFVSNRSDIEVRDFAGDYRQQFSGRPARDQVYELVRTDEDSGNLSQFMVDQLIDKARKDIAYFNLHVPMGAMICDNSRRQCGIESAAADSLVVTALFNNQPFHASAISLAAVDTAIVRYVAQNPNYTVSVVNHPLPLTTADKLLQVQYASPEQFQLSQNLIFSMSFLAASFAVLLVKESSIKGKHLQQVCGVKLYLFWLTSFIWDFFIYLIACIGVQLCYLAMNEEPLASLAQQSRLLVVFVTHGFALLPLVYLLSFLFDVPSTAYVRICLISLIVGIGAFLTVVVAELPLLDLKDTALSLDWSFSVLLPNYNLGRAVYNLYINYLGNKFCNIQILQKACNLGTVSAEEFVRMLREDFSQFSYLFEDYVNLIPKSMNVTIPVPDAIKACCKDKCGDRCFPWESNFYSVNNPGIGRLLIFFVLQAVVFWMLIVLVELKVIRNLKYRLIQLKIAIVGKFSGNRGKNLEMSDKLDDDVKAEAERIENRDLGKLVESDAMIIRKLTKYYGTFCAVDHISYGVHRGECFGLLGVNGAGKTTTFKMITGDETISEGDIRVNGYDVKTNIQAVQQQIGYCPQFDGLLEQLTGRETLALFCRLRGIREQDIGRHTDEISRLLYFDMHLDKLVKNYSGGTKRKLSTAVAMLGEPSVSFLDEPTTGVDPVARRCLWDALSKKLGEGRSIVLTSHSMEECEALCNRLIIMVNGRIACIGSPQQLKNKFGKGYTVRIKVRTGLVAAAATDGENASIATADDVSSSVKTPSTTTTTTTTTATTVNGDGRRQSRIAWRQNSVVSRDLVLDHNIDELKQSMDRWFPGCCHLMEIHYNLLNYHIDDPSISWSHIFGTIEKAKVLLNIEDYSVGQTTLEQIFLEFAKKQKEDLLL